MVVRVYIILISLTFTIAYTGCRPRNTCAAYHSVFLLHPELQTAHFSPFGEDSMPKTGKGNTNDNGISQGPTVKNWKKKHYKIPMKDQHLEPEEPGAPSDSGESQGNTYIGGPDFGDDSTSGATGW